MSKKSTLTFDINFTADLNDEEFKSMLGLDASRIPQPTILAKHDHNIHGRSLQGMTVDWSTRPGGSKNVVPVKN